jgi:hypothetical protein
VGPAVTNSLVVAQTVYDAVTDPANNYPNASSDIVPHTPSQVYTLLDLDRQAA